MRRTDSSVVGMAAGAFICLVATAMAMTAPNRYCNLCFALFAIAFLVFYIAAIMPIRIKGRSSGKS